MKRFLSLVVLLSVLCISVYADKADRTYEQERSLGETAFINQDWSEALLSYTKLIDNFSDRKIFDFELARLYTQRSICLAILDHLQEAWDDFEFASELVEHDSSSADIMDQSYKGKKCDVACCIWWANVCYRAADLIPNADFRGKVDGLIFSLENRCIYYCLGVSGKTDHLAGLLLVC